MLVVAHRTAATPRLLDEVRVRAGRSPCSFTLLVLRPDRDPEAEEASATLELALPLLDEAASGHVEGTIGDSDPFAAVEQAVEPGAFDEIIISTLPARVSHWPRRDLPHRARGARLAVTGVTAEQSERAPSDANCARFNGVVRPARRTAAGISGFSYRDTIRADDARVRAGR